MQRLEVAFAFGFSTCYGMGSDDLAGVHIGYIVPCLTEYGEQLFNLRAELLGYVRAGVCGCVGHLEQQAHTFGVEFERAVLGICQRAVAAFGALMVDGGFSTEGAVTVLNVVHGDRTAVLHALLDRAVGYDGHVSYRIDGLILTLVVLDVDSFDCVCFHCCESFVLGLVCEWPLFARASHTQLRGVVFYTDFHRFSRREEVFRAFPRYSVFVHLSFTLERRCKSTTKK